MLISPGAQSRAPQARLRSEVQIETYRDPYKGVIPRGGRLDTKFGLVTGIPERPAYFKQQQSEPPKKGLRGRERRMPKRGGKKRKKGGKELGKKLLSDKHLSTRANLYAWQPQETDQFRVCVFECVCVTFVKLFVCLTLCAPG